MIIASTSNSLSATLSGRTNFANQAELLKQQADAYLGSVGSFSFAVLPRFLPSSASQPALNSEGFPSTQTKVGGFEAYCAMSESELKDMDESRRAGLQRTEAIMAEREVIFERQQAVWQSRWNTYQQSVQDSANAPENTSSAPSASLSFIRQAG